MILLCLLFLLFLLVLLFLLAPIQPAMEAFEDAPLPPTLLDSYHQFVDFYNPFLVNWEKSITTALSLEVQQAPQPNPDNPVPPSSPPPVTRIQMNEYIGRLSDKLKQPLPPVADPLPKDIDNASLSSVLPLVPSDMTPYQNALTWMNQQMRDSQANLAGALQGVPPTSSAATIEGFDAAAPTCQEISQCLSNNPQFIAQVSQQVAQDQAQQQKKSAEDQQKELLQRIMPFLQNTSLSQSASTNQDLVKQLGTIQQQAQSGELYNQLNLPDKEPDIPTVFPAGALSLSAMQQQNPQQYNQLKDNYKQWVDVKQLIEQINRSL